MDFISTSEWQLYLPTYRFPRFLRLTCGCLGLLLLGGGIFAFLIAPGIISYVVTLDELPVLEISTGNTIRIDEYGLRFVRVERDTRCPGEVLCNPPGSVVLIFSTTVGSDEYTVVYTEGTEFSDPISLPLGYLMRVVSVSPDTTTVDGSYTAQFQIFKPPSPG